MEWQVWQCIEWALVFCFGIALGSFANVLIFRIPRALSLIYPNSFCPHCQTKLQWRDKIPLFSFLAYRAQCRHCKAKIPFYYISSEILGGIFAIFCYAWLGILGIFLFLLLLCFYVLSLIDWEFLEIPDSLNFANLALAILYGANALPTHWFGIAWLESLIFALCFMGFASFIRIFIGSIVCKEVLGEGDIIVFGALGAGLGLSGILAIFFGSALALFVLLLFKILKTNPQRLEIPFVPFLFMGFLIVILCHFFSFCNGI